MVKAILFDFDGTIVDSLKYIHPSWKSAFRALGKDLSDEEIIKNVYYTTQEDRAQRYGVDQEKLLENYRGMMEPNYERYELHDAHTKDMLKTAKEKGIKIGIISFGRSEKIRRISKRLGIEQYFDVILGARDVPRPKPNPDMAYKAMEMLGVEPADTVMIGDSAVDMMTAKNAGIKKGLFISDKNALYVDREFLDKTDPDFTFTTYEELLKKIAKM